MRESEGETRREALHRGDLADIFSSMRAVRKLLFASWYLQGMILVQAAEDAHVYEKGLGGSNTRKTNHTNEQNDSSETGFKLKFCIENGRIRWPT